MTPSNRIAVLLSLVALSANSSFAAPYEGKTFKGRIAYSADGNHNDPDDWIASPVALAIFAEAGLRDRLVHFDYNCILPQTDAEWEKIHATSVLGAVERYGYDRALFHDCRRDLDGAVASIAKAINDSTADNPLYFIVAGPMEVPVLGIEKSEPAKRKFVYCISHSAWNDGYAPRYTFTHTKRSVIATGINWVQIQDQNRLLSLSPYGKPGTPESFAAYHWMRDSDDAKVRFLWERMLVSTRPDPSDSGMAYFLATGDEQADPAKLKKLLDENIVPATVNARRQVRIEAENFIHLTGVEVEYRNDRSVPHRVNVRLAGGASGQIRTAVAQPYAADSGRYDVDVRYFDEQGGRCRLALAINGAPQGAAWESAGEGKGWSTHTISNVEMRSSDEIAVAIEGQGCRVDYVQLNSRTPDTQK
jgi:hypothetical protein